MNGLAVIVVDYLLTIMFANADLIDADYQAKLQESLTEHINPLTDAERDALSLAAQHRLDRLDSGPDEYGFDIGLHASPDQRAFLLALASGALYDGLEP